MDEKKENRPDALDEIVLEPFDENETPKNVGRSRLLGASLTLLEVLLIFGVFAAYGAWPVPDVNEQYYVGKAIHFWNHEWLGHDQFLNTPDSHWLFYCVFGLLSLVFKQNTLVWVGRCCVWIATAYAWRRLSWALIPIRWIAVLTAAAFAFYLESFHLAGEWIFGGIEGKALAFPFVFWGLACYLERKYNRAWILLGIASAFHVLVGGWVVLALLVVTAVCAIFDIDDKETNFRGNIATALACLRYSAFRCKTRVLSARVAKWNNAAECKTFRLPLSSNLTAIRNRLRTEAASEEALVAEVFESDLLESEIEENLKELRKADSELFASKRDELIDSLNKADTLVGKENDYVREGRRSILKSLLGLWGLFLGGAISLMGLIPALALDSGANAAELALSRRIYVYDRLSHHLVVSSLPWTFQLRFIGMVVLLAAAVWMCFTIVKSADRFDELYYEDDSCEVRARNRRFSPAAMRWTRLFMFSAVALAIAVIGACIDFGSLQLESHGAIETHKIAAGLLRYYWYRLSDWAIPLALVFSLGFVAINVYFEMGNKDDNNMLGMALTWLAGALGIYWIGRFVFYRIAVSVAAGKAVDGLVPLPKPTEALSFMTCVAFLGLLLAILSAIVRRLKNRISRWLLSGLVVWTVVLTLLAPGWRLATYIDLRGTKMIPRSAPPKESIADGWLDACHWCRDNTDSKAVFLVPRGCDSFKWEAQRAEAGSWKEIPQDAKSIVKWNKKMKAFYANPNAEPDSANYWNQPLVGVFINKGRATVLKEAKKYGYQYAVVETPPYVVATIPEALKRWKEFEKNDLVYQNDQYVVLKFDRSDEKKDEEKKAENKTDNEAAK